ncbi:MAG: helix-turn-helix domain-containing protein [Dethiosulfatibacter sp.]|nr:helix-turn-helix domain-containing protein [Dethiosulfatibacter sp.]
MGLDKLPEIITIQELSEFLKISEMTVRRAIESDGLKAFKVGTAWRIEKEAVIEWVNTKEN